MHRALFFMFLTIMMSDYLVASSHYTLGYQRYINTHSPTSSPLATVTREPFFPLHTYLQHPPSLKQTAIAHSPLTPPPTTASINSPSFNITTLTTNLSKEEFIDIISSLAPEKGISSGGYKYTLCFSISNEAPACGIGYYFDTKDSTLRKTVGDKAAIYEITGLEVDCNSMKIVDIDPDIYVGDLIVIGRFVGMTSEDRQIDIKDPREIEGIGEEDKMRLKLSAEKIA